jgi:hypothetical protein
MNTETKKSKSVTTENGDSPDMRRWALAYAKRCHRPDCLKGDWPE